MGLIDIFKLPPRISNIPRPLSTSQLRARVKTVVIDDEEESFPYKLLQDSGYTIEWWQKVDANKLQRLENGDFDVIILDIQGVADSTVTSKDGIGILRRIKSVNPHQVVVAFSGHSYDLSKTEFWRLADDTLNKPVTVIKCKELLDKLIQEKITLKNYWLAISELMHKNGIPDRTVRKFEKVMVKALQGNSNIDVKDTCRKLLGTIQNSAAIVTLIDAIMRLWK